MHKQFWKIVHALLAATFGVVSLALILLGWRLAQGPIAIPQATPYIAAALNSGRDDLQISLDQVLIAWNADSLSLDIELQNVVVADAEGEAIRVPTASIGLSGRGLISGWVAPVRVGLKNTIVTIVVYEDGRFALAGTVGGDGTGDALSESAIVPAQDRTPISPILLALLGPPDYQSTLGFLEQLALRNSLIIIENRQTNSNWAVTSNEMIIRRDDDGAHSLASGQVSRLNATGIALPPTPLDWSSRYNRSSGELAVTLNFDGLSIGDLVAQFVGVDFLKGSDAPVSGRVSGALMLDPSQGARLAGKDSGLSFSFDLGAGQILAGGGLFSQPFDIYGGRVAGAVAADFKTVEITQLRLAREPFILEGAAMLRDQSAGERSGFPKPEDWSIDATLYLDGLSVSQLKSLWPDTPTDGARRWVVANMDSGQISNGVFTLSIPAGFIGSGDRLPTSAIGLTFDLTNGQAQLLRPLPPLMAASGRGHLTATGFRVENIQGTIDGLSLTNGSFAIPDFSVKGANAEIALTLAGDLPRMMGFLDHEPFGYPSKAGLLPEEFAGDARADVQLGLPLIEDMAFADISLAVAGEVRNAVLPDIVKGYRFTDGALDISVTEDRLIAKGPIRVNDVPTMALWTQEFSVAEGDSGTYIKISSLTDDRTRALLGYDLAPYVGGLAQIGAEVTLKPGEGTNIRLTGDFASADVAMPVINWQKPADVPFSGGADIFIPFEGGGFAVNNARFTGTEFKLVGEAAMTAGGGIGHLNITELRAGSGTELTVATVPQADDGAVMTVRAVKADFRSDWLTEALALFSPQGAGEEVDSTDASGPGTSNAAQVISPVAQYNWLARQVTQDGHPIMHSMSGQFTPKAADDGTEGYLGALRASLLPLKASTQLSDSDKGGAPLVVAIKPLPNGAHFVSAETDNGGSLLRFVGLVEQARGGELLLETVIPDLTGLDQGAGRLRVNNIRIVKLPLLAQIVNFSSLSGLASALQGDGLLFNEIIVPFTIADGQVRVSDGRAVGPSVGIKARGIVGFNGAMDIDGTLAPAYTLNAALGKIPLIGQALVGGEGEGLFAVNFAIDSDADGRPPRVTVNPLSALTPGFLRGIFGDSNPVSNPAADKNKPQGTSANDNLPSLAPAPELGIDVPAAVEPQKPEAAGDAAEQEKGPPQIEAAPDTASDDVAK